MEFYEKLVGRFQDLSKVKNPALIKAKGKGVIIVVI